MCTQHSPHVDPVGVPIPFERLGRLLIACSQPVPSSEPQVIGALLLLTHRDDDQHQVTTLHDFLLSVIHFSGLRAVGVAYNGDHNKLLSLLAEVSASVPQLPSDIIFRLICPRDHTALEPQGWFELEWLTKEPTGMPMFLCSTLLTSTCLYATRTSVE